MGAWSPEFWETVLTLSAMECLAQLEALCERLYNSLDSAERAHAESTLKCFSVNTDYISQCQYILDNASTPYALLLASSSLLKQVTEHKLPLQLRLDIRNFLVCLQFFMPINVLRQKLHDQLPFYTQAVYCYFLSVLILCITSTINVYPTHLFAFFCFIFGHIKFSFEVDSISMG